MWFTNSLDVSTINHPIEASLVQTVDRAFRRLIADRRTMLDQLAQLQHTQQLLLDADHAFHQQFREQHNDSATFTDSEEGTKHAAIVKRAATTSSSPGKKKAKADTTVVDPRQSSPIPLLSQSAADPMADDAVSNALLADMFLADLGRQP